VAATTLAMLRGEDPAGLRQRLRRELLSRGVTDFVQDTLTPLSEAVGEAWARGEIGLHEEHVYTEVVQGLLRDVIANLSDPRGQPRIVLTTLPEEQHGLGLLMAAALLSLRGAYCISLGTQTPVQDIVQAARAHNAGVVALSFSIAYPHRRIAPALAELRQRLDLETELVGGRRRLRPRRAAGGGRARAAHPGGHPGCPGGLASLVHTRRLLNTPNRLGLGGRVCVCITFPCADRSLISDIRDLLADKLRKNIDAPSTSTSCSASSSSSTSAMPSWSCTTS
jgi:methylmalonyl-CoA mutase cobalamin-binding subunit